MQWAGFFTRTNPQVDGNVLFYWSDSAFRVHFDRMAVIIQRGNFAMHFKCDKNCTYNVRRIYYLNSANIPMSTEATDTSWEEKLFIC